MNRPLWTRGPRPFLGPSYTSRKPPTLLRHGWMLGVAVLAAVLSSPSLAVQVGATPSCFGEPATIVGSDGPDTIHGTPGPDVIYSGGGDDKIFGLGGDDLICGGDGADTIYGGHGNDRIAGGAGDDHLYGGDGNDTLNGGVGNDSLVGGDGTDVLNGGDGNDKLNGGAADDTLNGSTGDDTLEGDEGNDTLNAGPGNDVLSGGENDDVLNAGDGNDLLQGDAGNDILRGGPGTDVLYGDDGDDLLYGGDGNDILNGGPGADSLDGGTGADTFDWFYPASDVVMDLSTDDTVNMNWLGASQPASFTVPIPIYGDSALDLVRTTLRPQIRSNDPLILSSGNVSGTIDTTWVNDAAAALHRELPENPIFVLTSGSANISTASTEITAPVSAVLYGYEPNMPNEPEFSWDFASTTKLVQEEASVLRLNGMGAGLYPTGRPVLQKYQTDDGTWVPYDWDYGALRSETDEMLVQTQTYCAHGLSQFSSALSKLSQQMQSHGFAGEWYAQVTIAPNNTNTVSLNQAEQCTTVAGNTDVAGMVVWWSPQHVVDMQSFLSFLGREIQP